LAPFVSNGVCLKVWSVNDFFCLFVSFCVQRGTGQGSRATVIRTLFSTSFVCCVVIVFFIFRQNIFYRLHIKKYSF
jgi:hypothetical protein